MSLQVLTGRSDTRVAIETTTGALHVVSVTGGETVTVTDMGSILGGGRTLSAAFINANTNGDNELIAAGASGLKSKIVWLHVFAEEAVDVVLQDGGTATALSPVWKLDDYTGFTLGSTDRNAEPIFKNATAAKAVDVNVSAATKDVAVAVLYFQEA